MHEEKLMALIDKINYHNEIYHGKGESEISDSAYDAMVKEVEILIQECEDDKVKEKAEEILNSVGYKPCYGNKISHSIPMGSLNKVHYDIDEMVKWANKYLSKSIIAMPKVDGLACRIVYKNGIIKLAATRGDGKVGQDVTNNILECKHIPQTIDTKIEVEFRGEIYMPHSEFEMLKRDGMSFANPRNAAAGSLMQKDAKETGKRNLHFIVYDILGSPITNYSKRIDSAKEFGFEVVPYVEVASINKENIEQAIKYIEQQRSYFPYDTDGIVFTVDNSLFVDDEGEVGGKPYAKMAYKFPPEKATSIISNIKWQTGRTGRVTPVAEIVPTKLAGSTITRLSVHNISEIKRLDVSIGDEVEIIKAGDIIPQITKVTNRTNKAREIKEPVYCSECGGDIENNGIELFCTNELCIAKLERRILHYIETLDIKGIGISVVKTLIEKEMIKDIPDLYNISVNNLASIDGYGEKSARQIVMAILEKSSVPLDIFIASLGIENIGKRAAKEIANKFKTLQKTREAKPIDLIMIEGFGEKMVETFTKGMKKYSNIIDSLSEILDIEEIKEIDGVLKGKSFCVTGTLSKKRNDIHDDITKAGGEIHTSVKKSTTYLVAGDNVGANKTDKARKYGVKVIDEEGLYAMIK